MCQSAAAPRQARLDTRDDTWFVSVQSATLIPAILRGSESIALTGPDYLTDKVSADVAFLIRESHSRGLLFWILHAMDAERRREWFSRLNTGGRVRVEAFALNNGLVGLAFEIVTCDSSGQITVELSPTLAFLQHEWDREMGRIQTEFEIQLVKEGKDVADKQRDAEKKQATADFALRVVSALPRAAWFPSLVDVAEPSIFREKYTHDPQRLADLIERRLSEYKLPLAADGEYSVSLLRHESIDRNGLLVCYFPREMSSTLLECISAAKVRVPPAFRAPLLSSVSTPPDGALLEPLPILLNDILADQVLIQELEVVPAEAVEQMRQTFRDKGTDALGWYQSCHTWDEDHWGIYLHRPNLVAFARDLAERLAQAGCRNHFQDALLLALCLVWEHEFFHTRVDLFALHEESMHRLPLLHRYQEQVYEPARRSSGPLEEAVANWVAHKAACELMAGWKAAGKWEQRTANAAVEFIEEVFGESPPGYRDWVLGADRLVWRKLVEQVITGNTVVGDPLPHEDHLAALPQVLSNREEIPVWLGVVARQAEPLFSTPRRREAERVLRKRGYRPRKGHSGHIVWESEDGRETFSLPSSPMLSVHVFHGFLHHLGVTKKEYMTMR